jgi:hexosaminidase
MRLILCRKLAVLQKKFYMHKIFIFIVVVLSHTVLAEIAVIPLPNSITRTSKGVFEFTPKTILAADANLQPLAKQLVHFLSPAFGFHLRSDKGKQTGNIIKLQLNNNLEFLGKEGYCLKVNSDAVLIEAYRPAGIFYGIQTLRQLLPAEVFSNHKIKNAKWQIPSVEIKDSPRFEWRGLHLDVSRHFMPVDFIKKYIDIMATHKLNRFHWHLTDRPGWRIEIEKYPELTRIGAKYNYSILQRYKNDPNRIPKNKKYGGYYTQKQIREIVKYAYERFVEIVPEIEMPGHSNAAILSYPWLSCDGKGGEYCPGKEEVFRFNEEVLREAMELFPGKYIHIGGDEVRKKSWRACSKCKARMIAEDINDVNGLQPYFTARIEKFITKNGRRMVGWDNILDGKINSQSVVMYWRNGDYAIKAAKQGNDVIIATPKYYYFDFYQGDANTEPKAYNRFLPLQRVYAHNPMPEGLTPQEQKHILGVQACLWTEFIPTTVHTEYMTYPRGCALAEVGWTKFEKNNYSDFLVRLNEHLKRLDNYGVNYRKLDK